MRVKATREGLVGKSTVSGYVIDRIVPFLALPSGKALGRFIKITNPINEVSTHAVVLDVGPWNTRDDPYVFGGQRPAAEAQMPGSDQVDEFKRHTNGAGIDLSERAWDLLGMRDNGFVEWEFL